MGGFHLITIVYNHNKSSSQLTFVFNVKETSTDVKVTKCTSSFVFKYQDYFNIGVSVRFLFLNDKYDVLDMWAHTTSLSLPRF
jgi:hypothetical protein